MTIGTATPLRPRGRGFARAASALGATLLLGAATIGTAPTASAAQGTTLRSAMAGQVDSLNPFLGYLKGSLDVYAAVYPTLNTLKADGTPGPYLATSWSTSPDKLTWTFKIRDGLKWSDGKPLTAEDAAWTLNLIMTDDIAGTANGSLVENFASVSAPDPTTLVIKTKAPQANMLYVSIPVSGIPIVPKHIWESHVAGLKDYTNDSFPLVGYGPWTLTQYKTEQYAKFDANKKFVLGAPKFDHLIQQSFKTSDAAVAALRSGQLDFVNNASLNSTLYESLKGQKSVQTFQEVGNRWTAVEINAGAKTRTGKKIGTGNPALADATLRTAIALATDKQTLVDKVLGGLGTVSHSYLPPAWPQWSWNPAAGEKLDHDPAKANQMLDDAGYTKGQDGVRTDPRTKKPLVLRLGIHSDTSRDTQVSTYMSGWLKQIGIKVDIQALSSTKLNDDLAKGDWDMLMDSWSTGADPTYLLGIQTCDARPNDDGSAGSTDAFFCDPEYDRLFKQQVITFDPAERAKIIGQMQSILYKANSDLTLYYANGLNAVRSDTVTGLAEGKPDADGLYQPQTTFWNFLNATPAAGGKAASSSGNGTLIGVGVAVVVVILAGAVFVIRRRAGADERE
ncbi:ABC transporter substrate-binding protein [Streptomyces sp. NPDC002574]|uniref:ABC transporter substrate-binding protein n=1 Tax=Streptomyces sp. NPDC002574 TaxID=3364652 RepID=UPI0036CB647A